MCGVAEQFPDNHFGRSHKRPRTADL